MPSAACTVKDGAGSPQTTPPYALVTPGNTVTIALADATGASTWTIVCIYTDETSDAAAVNAGLTVNLGNHTATFTAPDAGKAYIFQSQINSGIDVNGTIIPAYTKTFKVATETSSGLKVGALNETWEHNADFGFTAVINEAIRNIGGASQGAYTVTTAVYTQPAIGSTVSVSVQSTAWMAVGQPLFVMGGGFYVITAIGGSTSVTLRNLGYYDSSVAGTSVSSGAGVVASGVLPTRFPPLYTTPYVYFPFNEGVSPGSTYANQGTGGAAFNLTISGGAQLDWATPSPVGYCLTNGIGASPGSGTTLSNPSCNFSGGFTTNHSIEVIARRLSPSTTTVISMNPGLTIEMASGFNYITSHKDPVQTLNTGGLGGQQDAWYHFMGTCDGVNSRVYVNGVLTGVGNLTGGPIASINSVMSIAIGRISLCRLAIYPVTVPQSYARDVTRALNMWP